METKTYGYSPSDYAKFKKYANYTLFGFGILYMFYYNGRQNMSLVLSDLAASFGTDKAGAGMVTSALFWCYGFGHLFSGRLGEIVGNKKFIMIGVVISAICNLLISFQTSLVMIAILWGLNGFAQSMAWSPGLGMVNQWWPVEKRGYSAGVATGFSGVAQVVTYGCVMLALTISPDWGWRAAFRWPLIPMVAILVVFAALCKDKPEVVGLAPFEEPDAASSAQDAERARLIKEKGQLYAYKLMFSEPKVIVMCLVIAIAGIGRYGLLTWVPTYFKEVMGLSIKAGIFSSILLPIGQACAMYIFPVLTDKVFKGKREPLLILCAIVTAVVMPAFPFIKSQMLASCVLFVVGVSGMVTGILWAVAGDLGGKALSGTATGILDWAAYMGAAIQSMFFGTVVEATGNWNLPFIIIAVLYVIMVILAFMARKMKLRNL